MTTTIYAIRDAFGVIRYIGKTKDMRVRWQCHIRDSRRGRRVVCSWLRKAIREGNRPDYLILDECEGDGAELETAYVRAGRLAGFDLLNMTAGGEGCVGFTHSPESRAKMSAMRKGIPKPEWFKRMLSEKTKGRPVPPERAARSAATRRGRPACSDWRIGVAAAKIANTGRKASPETLLKMSKARKGKPSPLRGVKQSPELVARRMAALRNSDSWRESIRNRGPLFHGKLSESDVRLIKQLFRHGDNSKELGARFGVSYKTIWAIGTGRCYKSVAAA